MLRRKARQFVSDLIDSLDGGSWNLSVVGGCSSLQNETLVVFIANAQVAIMTTSEDITPVWLPLLQQRRLRRAVRRCLIERAHVLVPMSGL